MTDEERAHHLRRIERFEALRTSEPDDLLVRFGLALEYVAVGRHADAAAETREALRIQPTHSAAYRVLGRALLDAGRPEEAADALRQGIEIAERQGDLMTLREMRATLRRIDG